MIQTSVRAFSLIEVMLAVGLMAFVLTAILGLVALAVRGTKNADMDARLAVLTSRISSGYQSRGYSAALAAVSTNGTTYYDFYGAPTNAAAAYFRCDAVNATPAGNSTNYALLRLAISWPAANPGSTNIHVSSVFNAQ